MTRPYLSPLRLRRAVEIVDDGGVIAYPTEAVFGLGCDPFDAGAVLRILDLKRRSPDKGLILVAADFDQLAPLLRPLPAARRQAVIATWPGPHTWIWPAHPAVPALLTGAHDSLAVRISDHPVVRALCRARGGPLVSTSANPADHRPARTALAVRRYFGGNLDLILTGRCGGQRRPTPIRDAESGDLVRGP